MTCDISGAVSSLVEKWKEGERGEGEKRRKKRSLMIKLSPDLVFDRGRSYTATTRRLCPCMQIHTHVHSTSDKPNYDPVRQLNSQMGCVDVCVCER